MKIWCPSRFHDWIGRGFARGGVHDPEGLRQWQPEGFLQRPAGHPLRDRIEEGYLVRSVGADHRVADRIQRHLGAALFTEQGLFEDLAGNRAAQGAHQFAGFDLALDQIVLRAIRYGLHGDRLVRLARQHHDGSASRGGVGPQHPLQTRRIGATQVQQDNVNRFEGKVRFGIRQAIHMRQREGIRALIFEHLVDQTRFFWVVLDQKYRLAGSLAH